MTFNISWLSKTTEALDKSVAGIEKISDRLDDLNKKVAEPKVKVDTSQADREIDELNRKVSGIGNIDIGKGGLIGAGVIAGAGAAVAGGILAIPTAIAAIGVAAEKTNPEVVASFGDLKTVGQQVLRQGFAPLAPALAQFGDEAKISLANVKGELQQGASAAAPLVSIIGDDLLKAAQMGIGGAVPLIQSMRPAAQALGGDLVKVEQGAEGFLKNLNVGAASKGLSELGDDVEQILPPLGSLLSEVMPLGNAMLGVLGPGIRSIESAAGALTPLINGAAGAISFLTPDVAAFAGPAAIAVAITKLFTGSWTDFTGVINKVKPLITDTSSVVGNLGQKIGITTAAQAAANKADLEAALVKAQLTKATAEEVAITAAWTAEEAGTAETELAAVAATEALTEAETELTAATAAAAAASAEASFSFGPLGIALGAVALLAVPFVLGMGQAQDSASDLSQQIIQLGQDGPAAAASLAASSPDLQAISSDLIKVGSSAGVFAQAFAGSVPSAQAYTGALTDAQGALGGLATSVTKGQVAQSKGQRSYDSTRLSVAELTKFVNSNKAAHDALSPALRSQVDEYNAYNNIISQARDALKDMRAAQDAEDAALAKEGIALDHTSTMWQNYGNAIVKNSTDFDSATSGIKSITDNLVASNAAFFSAQQNFAQLDAAVAQAKQGYEQAMQGVASAGHSLAQASQGVSDAQHSEKESVDAVVTAQQGEKQALQGVITAEQQVAQAKKASQQAEQDLMDARKAAAQQLADLTRQVASQGDSEEEARLRVFDAQTAVNNAHIQGKSIASLGPVSTANEANIQLLLALQEAQHNLNQVTAQGQQLAAQNAAAQKAGINGSAQVVTAQQQVAQSQQQAAQAATGLKSAQQAVTQASKGVSQAQYAEQQAHLATQNAVYSEQQASLALRSAKDAVTVASAAKKVAQDNDSRSTDINTVAGIGNFKMIEQLFEDNKLATGDIGLATAATEAQGEKMGINKKAIDGVITSISKIPKTTPFAIVGTPSLNLSALVQQASAEDIDPFKLFGKSQQHNVSLAIGDMNGHAEGGRISGPGTGTSDSIIARGDNGMLRVSNGEYIVKEKQTSKFLPLLEDINNDRLPGDAWFGGGYAGGGVVDGKSLMKVNYQLAGYDAFLQATSNILHVFGVNTPNLPKPGSADLGSLGGGSSMFGSDLGLRGSRAANESIVKNVWASMFGWTGQEWAATVPLLMQESGFNNVAQNPTSTAYGIFQFPDSTWGGYGIAKTSDPNRQSVAGGRYIKARYGDPETALQHEHAFNWYRNGGMVGLKPPKSYDSGGWLGPGDTGRNKLGKPEAVLTPEESAAFVQLAKSIGSGSSGSPIEIHVHTAQGASTDQIVTEVMRRLQFHGRG